MNLLDGELWKSGSCSLSVGQQQLLSLARAALRPSPVLILDEPSSALDTEAEQTLHHCLDHLFSSRTIILISVIFIQINYFIYLITLINYIASSFKLEEM